MPNCTEAKKTSIDSWQLYMKLHFLDKLHELPADKATPGKTHTSSIEVDLLIISTYVISAALLAELDAAYAFGKSSNAEIL